MLIQDKFEQIIITRHVTRLRGVEICFISPTRVTIVEKTSNVDISKKLHINPLEPRGNYTHYSSILTCKFTFCDCASHMNIRINNCYFPKQH